MGASGVAIRRNSTPYNKPRRIRPNSTSTSVCVPWPNVDNMRANLCAISKPYIFTVCIAATFNDCARRHTRGLGNSAYDRCLIVIPYPRGPDPVIHTARIFSPIIIDVKKLLHSVCRGHSSPRYRNQVALVVAIDSRIYATRPCRSSLKKPRGIKCICIGYIIG